MFSFARIPAKVGTESEFTIRAIMCQSSALSCLKQVTNKLVDEKVLVVQCQTGYHRAETVGTVVSGVFSNHSRQHEVLHLPMARTYRQDIEHDIRVALQFAEHGFGRHARHPREPFASSTYRIRAACFTRPEAWTNYELYEESRSQLANCLHMLGSLLVATVKVIVC